MLWLSLVFALFQGCVPDSCALGTMNIGSPHHCQLVRSIRSAATAILAWHAMSTAYVIAPNSNCDLGGLQFVYYCACIAKHVPVILQFVVSSRSMVQCCAVLVAC